MKIQNRQLLSLILALTLIFSCLSLTSCFGLTSPLLSGEEDGGQNDNTQNSQNITINSGDTNNITINSQDSSTLLSASKAMLSVVSVYAKFEQDYVTGWGPGAYTTTQPFSSIGSGVIYKLDKDNGDAYVITNYHVIYSSYDNSETKISRNINLYLYGMEYTEYAIPAEFVGGSMLYDIAVLKVTGSDVLRSSLAVAADVANSDDIAVLDTAIAIGNPDSYGISATVGYINVDSEEIEILGADDITVITMRVMRVDAAINEGNSGGGLFNGKGELIGIVNAKKVTSENMGYAIPSNIATNVADNIIYYCNGEDKTTVQRCILGITVTASELYVEYDEETGRLHRREVVAVDAITANSVAEEIFEVGDVINSITINGETQKVTRMFHVVDYMLNARVGDTVVFSITRGGSPMQLEITMTEATITSYR